MEKLKPCPFCGGEVRMMHDIDGTPSGVHCKCGALTRFLFMPKKVRENFGETHRRIAERWNRRVTDEYIDQGHEDA